MKKLKKVIFNFKKITLKIYVFKEFVRNKKIRKRNVKIHKKKQKGINEKKNIGKFKTFFLFYHKQFLFLNCHWVEL